MVVKFRSGSDAKDTIKKLKKMHKFTKELIECFEDKMEDDDEYDDEYEDYRDDEETERMNERGGSRYRRGRYRRGM